MQLLQLAHKTRDGGCDPRLPHLAVFASCALKLLHRPRRESWVVVREHQAVEPTKLLFYHPPRRPADLGFGRIVVLEVEVPNHLVNPMYCE